MNSSNTGDLNASCPRPFHIFAAIVETLVNHKTTGDEQYEAYENAVLQADWTVDKEQVIKHWDRSKKSIDYEILDVEWNVTNLDFHEFKDPSSWVCYLDLYKSITYKVYGSHGGKGKEINLELAPPR